MRIVAKTDVGLVRKRNEDFFIIAQAHDLVVLCDGMGGHPGGDLASRMVAEEVERGVGVEGENPAILDPTGQAVTAIEPFVPLLHAVFTADLKLRDYGKRHTEFQGMGTTVVAIQELQGVVCVAHVGDSRVYTFRRNHLTQVTHDHSVVATHPEYAHLAGMRNILTRAMGVGESLEVDFTIVPADKDEMYLLCTDGLHNYVSEERIGEILESGDSAETKVDQLIEEAKKGGGGDNITLSLAWPTGAATSKRRRLSGVVTETDSHLLVHLEPGA